jgi:hypothetical protein
VAVRFMLRVIGGLRGSILKVSRADFLRSCGIALLGQHLYSRAFPDALQAATIDDLAGAPRDIQRSETFTAAWFRPHINTEFTLRAAEGLRGSLVLAKITERPVFGNVAQFSLIFHGNAKMEFGGGSCSIDHRSLGSLDLFIAPIGRRDSRGQKYQACFSRFVDAGEPGNVRGGRV